MTSRQRQRVSTSPQPQTAEPANRVNAQTPGSSNQSQPHEALLFQIHMLMKERGLKTRVDVTYPYDKIDEQSGQLIESFQQPPVYDVKFYY